MKVMVMGKIALVTLVLCVGFGSAHPSAAEFNLFCRILAKANDLMYGPDYVYDENVDKEIVKEMMVLYNATTSNMNEFRKTLWVTKDFFEEHPPPTDPKNRQAAHREIDKLIKEGEKKIEENKKIEKKVNEEIKEAKLSVAKGIFGDEVKELPKQDGNLTEILNKPGSIFNDEHSATRSCGDTEKKAGKTLLNDFFCVCVGDTDADGPCSPHILPSKHGDGRGGGWKTMKYKASSNEKKVLQFTESYKQIEKACTEELIREEEQTKDMNSLLDEYVGMIWNGTAGDADGKKFFGHSERKKKNHVKQCDGRQGSNGSNNNDNYNEQICVDYRHNQNQDGHYDIPWHNKFKNYSTFLNDAKNLEEKILKNRADLLLLKSQAWIAYSREKDDETSNLDDMNISNLFDGSRVSPPFLPSVFFFYF